MNQACPLDRLLALQHLGIKFGLDNIRALCGALGRPERRFASIIVAGTNGKGSVTALLDHALRAAGFRAARYTSPHLVHLEERFAIDGAPVGRARLERAAARVLAAADALRSSGARSAQPTFFEATTAIAFELFAESGVEVAVLEVGLGGRFDATNVVTPIAAAITSIDLDHQQFLGSTLEAIAFEKAGVIKPGMPVVVGERKRDAVDVIRRVCGERGATFIDAWEGTTVDRDGDRVQIRTRRASYGPLTLALAGDHQVANALVAVRLLEQLAPSFPVPVDAAIAALRDVRWPARLEWLSFPGGRRLLLDAAHNPAGASALAAFLARAVGRPLPIVLAVMRDKDARGIVSALAPHASAFVVTRPPGVDRAADPEALAGAVREAAPACAVEIAAAPREALARAFELAPVACACGSIFLAGAILEIHGNA